MEKNAYELRELISTFNDHIEVQHEMVDHINENTNKAVSEVDEVGC